MSHTKLFYYYMTANQRYISRDEIYRNKRDNPAQYRTKSPGTLKMWGKDRCHMTRKGEKFQPPNNSPAMLPHVTHVAISLNSEITILCQGG